MPCTSRYADCLRNWGQGLGEMGVKTTQFFLWFLGVCERTGNEPTRNLAQEKALWIWITTLHDWSLVPHIHSSQPACKCRKTANLNHPAGPWQIQKHNIRNKNTLPAAHTDLTLQREYTSTLHLLWEKMMKKCDRTIAYTVLIKRKERENNIYYFI